MKKHLLSLLFVLLNAAFVLGQGISYSKNKTQNSQKEKTNYYIQFLDTLQWRYLENTAYGNQINEADKFCRKYGTETQKRQLELVRLLYHFYNFEMTPKEVTSWLNKNEANYLLLKNPILKANYHLAIGIIRENKGLDGLVDFQKAAALYEKYAPNNNHLIDAYHRLATYYRYSGTPDSVIYFLGKGITYLENNNDDYFYFIFKIDKALYYQSEMKYSEGIKLCIELLNDKNITISLTTRCKVENQLASLYTDNKEYDKALDILNQSLPSAKKILKNGNTRLLSDLFLQLSTLYVHRQEYQKALMALDSTKKYISHLDEATKGWLIMLIKVQAYTGLREYKTAEQLLTSVLYATYANTHLQRYRSTTLAQNSLKNNALNTQVGSEFMPSYGSFQVYQKIFSKICLKLYSEGDLIPNEELSKDIEAFAQYYIKKNKNKYNQETLASAQLLTLLQVIKTKNPSLKASYLQTIALQDELSDQRNKRLTQDLLVQYQTKEKEQQIQVQTLELSRKNTQRNILISGFIITLLALWYLGNRNKMLQQNLENKERIAQQAEELKRLYHQQNRLFVNIAHELRTPLTLINAPLNAILKKTDTTSSVQQDLFTAKRNVNYLQQMINQILDLSKIQSEPLALSVSRFQIGDLLNSLKNDFQPLAQYQKIDFQTLILTSSELELITDGEKLFTVLKNLLSNAFKYTPSLGTISLSVSNLEDKLQIIVQDNGKGISKTDLPRIFEHFYQTSDKEKLVEGGTGIGLTICKEYVEAIQGAIQVSSEAGLCTCFIVTIPRVIQGVPVNPDATLSFLQYQKINTTPITTLQKLDYSSVLPNLLVVEDNLGIANYLADILKEDYNLYFNSNGEEALKALETLTPDLIITDLMMPIVNGFELIETLKKNDKWCKIPIITLTALSEMAHKIKALRFGVDDYLVKPFNEEELQVKIINLLDNQAERANVAALTKVIEVAAEEEEAPPSKNEDDLWLERLESLARQHITDIDFNVNMLAQLMTMSYHTLYHRMKVLIGITPNEYLNQMRFQVARELLESKKFNSVKKVAYAVGFKDEKNFSRNFKKRFGKYPSEYLE